MPAFEAKGVAPAEELTGHVEGVGEGGLAPETFGRPQRRDPGGGAGTGGEGGAGEAEGDFKAFDQTLGANVDMAERGAFGGRVPESNLGARVRWWGTGFGMVAWMGGDRCVGVAEPKDR